MKIKLDIETQISKEEITTGFYWGKIKDDRYEIIYMDGDYPFSKLNPLEKKIFLSDIEAFIPIRVPKIRIYDDFCHIKLLMENLWNKTKGSFFNTIKMNRLHKEMVSLQRMLPKYKNIEVPKEDGFYLATECHVDMPDDFVANGDSLASMRFSLKHYIIKIYSMNGFKQINKLSEYQVCETIPKNLKDVVLFQKIHNPNEKSEG